MKPRVPITIGPKTKNYLAQNLLNNDIKVTDWASGLNKGLSQVLGIKAMKDSENQDKADVAQGNNVMAQALGLYKGSPAGLDQSTGITWNQERKPDEASALAMMLGNEKTAPYAMQLQLNEMEGQGNLKNKIAETQALMPYELQLARAKAQIDASNRAPPSSVQEWQYGQSHPEFAKYQQSEGSKASKVWGDAQKLVEASKDTDHPLDLLTAYSMAKSGLGVGRTMVDGAAAPVPGALDTAKAFKSFEAAGTEVGKQEGEAEAKLQAMSAQYPRLVEVTQELSNLGQKATYNVAGRARDTALREAGLPVGEGATARAEYISKVDNEILPLLRQTFGSQFTAREGDSLRATLGDANKSPQEKDAVLKSFISQKAAQIGTLQNQVGAQSSTPAQPSVVNWEDLP